MQALIELLAGFIAILAAAALSQFGVELHSPSSDREIHRVSDCGDKPSSAAVISVVSSEKQRNC